MDIVIAGGGVAGLEALLALQTGGGRYSDWILHYEIARHYAVHPAQIVVARQDSDFKIVNVHPQLPSTMARRAFPSS